MKIFADFNFDVLSLERTAEHWQIAFLRIGWNDRCGALLAFSVAFCPCGDPDCGGREIGMDLFWTMLFQK